MKYDPKKSLNENKILLEDENCIPLNTNLSEFVQGSNRSDSYPTLGQWGDGKCKCTENLSCLEFKSECCKTPSSGAEQSRKNYYGLDGRILDLPSDVKILSVHNAQTWAQMDMNTWLKTGPGVDAVNSCKQNNPVTEYESCLNMFKEKWSNDFKDKAIFSFEVNGSKFSPCYITHTTDSQGLKSYYTVDKLRTHTGYGSSCKDNNMWTKYKQEEKKDNTENTNNNSKYGAKYNLTAPNQTPSFDSETIINFDLEL